MNADGVKCIKQIKAMTLVGALIPETAWKTMETLLLPADIKVKITRNHTHTYLLANFVGAI